MFGRKQAPPLVLTEKELGQEFEENVMIVGDMTSRPGARRHSVLGPDRRQITLNVGASILAAIIRNLDNKGGKLDVPISDLYTEKARRRWASSRLSHMAAFATVADADDPFDHFHRAAGKLIPVGFTSTGRRLQVYAVSSSLTPIEARAALELARTKASDGARRSHSKSNVLLRIISAIEDTGMTPGEGYARFCEGHRLKASS